MILFSQAPNGSDELVEVSVPAASFSPDSIADAGQVRQGGLHDLLPWVIGKLLGL